MKPPRVDFSVEGLPLGKARPRITQFGTFTPAKTKHYQHALGLAARAAMGAREPFQCPVEVIILACFEPPGSWSERRKTAAVARRFAPIGKPDLDNVAKAVLDALNGVIFKDDAQCYHLSISREFARQAQTCVRVIARPDLIYTPQGSPRAHAETATMEAYRYDD